jgi:CBS domain-containing membrane protein
VSRLLRWLAGFFPHPVALRWPERVRACLGALVGIACTGVVMRLLLSNHPAAIPLLVAPMGASAVLLFAVPASPLAQPWSLVGGNLVSAAVGVMCAKWLHDPLIASALAVALAITAMFALRCVHPPSGAVALTAVLGGHDIHALGFGFVVSPILLQSIALLGAAIVYHAATGHRYPHAGRAAPPSNKTGPVATEIAGDAPLDPSAANFTRRDLEAVLRRQRDYLDIDPDDLEALLREVQLQAYARTFAELTCADIMSTGIVSVTSRTGTLDAHNLLKRHHVKALPVINDTRTLIGIVTRADLVQAGPQNARTVDCVMTRKVDTVNCATPITDLVPLFTHLGHHHIPVLDRDRHVAGMITQADLIAGLYRHSVQPQLHSAFASADALT